MTRPHPSPAFFASAFVLFAINALNYYDRQVAGALTEPIRREFHLTDTQIGLLTTAFIWIYAIVGVPLGVLADGWGRKRVLAIGLFVWSSLTAAAGVAQNFGTLLASRMGVGVGEAACAPAATSWLAELCPEELRTRALAIFMLGIPIGGALSFLFSGMIAHAYGWRMAMMLAAAPALLLLPALFMIPEPTREKAKAGVTFRGMGQFLRLPTFWWIVVSGALFNFNGYVVGFFTPAFFGRTHQLSLREATTAMAGVYLAGGICGALGGGALGDRLVQSRRNARMVLASGFALLAAPAAFLGFSLPAGHFWESFALLVIAYGFMTPYFGLVYASLQDIVTPELRATAMAVYLLGMYLLGGSMGPLAIGMLSDHYAKLTAGAAGAAGLNEVSRAVGLQHALEWLPVIFLLQAVVLYLGSRSIEGDIVRREVAQS